MSIFLSMAAFALAASISPGPVNIVALGTGAQYGFSSSMRHVSGATLGFTLLLLLTGLGLHELMTRWPLLLEAVRWGGIAFFVFMAYKLAIDNGELGMGQNTKGPSFLYGAAMQWLNPKAWLAALAGMGSYASNGELVLIWQFAAIFFVVCYLSIACWAYAGAFLHHYLQNSAHVRFLNRILAALLSGSAAYLLIA
jgi:threonine/homoserine/homoserine lactone efflux protein